MIKVLLADDHALVRNGIKSLLEDVDSIEVVAEASDGEEAIEMYNSLIPDVMIIDIRMPKMNGIDAVSELCSIHPNINALVLSMHDSEDYVLKSVEAGAKGYLLKDTNKSEFIRAIETVYEGKKYFSGAITPVFVNKYLEGLGSTTKPNLKSESTAQLSDEPVVKLTKRQKEILDLAVQGLSNKEIADHLGKSIRTVEAHRFSMMKKLEVKNLMELINKAKSLGLV